MNIALSRRAVLTLVAALPLAARAGAARAQGEQPRGDTVAGSAPAGSGPTAPVVALDDGLLAVMKAGKATPFEARVRMFTPIAQQAFDLEQILQVSIGPRFANFPAQSQSELLSTFTDYTAASYVANFDSYTGERFDVSPDIRKVGTESIVQTRIVPAKGDSTRLDYVVRSNGGPFRIVDVLFDGSISRVAVQRSDFRSLLASGDPAPLIAMLRNKIAGLSSGATE
jgi:phospholipid transport system substrate-binding protein